MCFFVAGLEYFSNISFTSLLVGNSFLSTLVLLGLNVTLAFRPSSSLQAPQKSFPARHVGLAKQTLDLHPSWPACGFSCLWVDVLSPFAFLANSERGAARRVMEGVSRHLLYSAKRSCSTFTFLGDTSLATLLTYQGHT